MSAAVLQGVPVTTLDVDIWLDLPPRQYMRAANLAVKLGATMRANTVFILPGDTMVNFLYEVHGLGSFALEYRRCRQVRWMGLKVPVLPLERLLKSKEFLRRPKDLAHLPILRQTLRAGRLAKRKPKS